MTTPVLAFLQNTTMGLLDPVYRAVEGTIAGAGAVAGNTVGGVGAAISSTGRNIGDAVAGTANYYGDYAKDVGNYVKDSTKASGARTGTAVNPLGLTRDAKASREYGINTSSYPYKKSTGDAKKAIGAPPARKQITAGAPSAAPKSAAKGTQGKGATTASKPSTPASKGVMGAAKSTGGTVTGAKKPTGTVTGAAKNPTGTVTGAKPTGTVNGAKGGPAKKVTGAAKK